MIADLEHEEYVVLRKVKNGLQPKRKDHAFSIALLIVEGCVIWNEKEDTLSITELGEETLEELKEEYRWVGQ